MPFLDGTGPQGKGARSGRGLGICTKSSRKNMFGGYGHCTFGNLALAALGVIVKDALNPDGTVRRILGTIRCRLGGKASTDTKKRIDTEAGTKKKLPVRQDFPRGSGTGT